MDNVTYCLSVVFSLLFLWQTLPPSLLSATCRGGGLLIRSLSRAGQASAIAVCACIVCIKLFLVFLLSLEF